MHILNQRLIQPWFKLPLFRHSVRNILFSCLLIVFHICLFNNVNLLNVHFPIVLTYSLIALMSFWIMRFIIVVFMWFFCTDWLLLDCCIAVEIIDVQFFKFCRIWSCSYYIGLWSAMIIFDGYQFWNLFWGNSILLQIIWMRFLFKTTGLNTVSRSRLFLFICLLIHISGLRKFLRWWCMVCTFSILVS